jgi:hypothetical protein
MIDNAIVGRIGAEAREIQFGRTILTILAAIFFALGWISARVLGFVWFALAWSATAVKVGWIEGRK